MAGCDNCHCGTENPTGAVPGMDVRDISLLQFLDALLGPKATGFGVERAPLREPSVGSVGQPDDPAGTQPESDLRQQIRGLLSPDEYIGWCKGQVHMMMILHGAPDAQDMSGFALSEARAFLSELG